MEDFPIMTPTRVGLPNSCSRCGEPVKEDHWMAIHADAARSGDGLCVPCYVDEKALNDLAEAVGAVNLEPNEVQQFIGQIPDEDILVTGGSPAGREAGTTVQPEEPVTEPPIAAPTVVTKPKSRRRKS